MLKRNHFAFFHLFSQTYDYAQWFNIGKQTFITQSIRFSNDRNSETMFQILGYIALNLQR